eukprot:66943-Karenia_brevis.AAC.1
MFIFVQASGEEPKQLEVEPTDKVHMIKEKLGWQCWYRLCHKGKPMNAREPLSKYDVQPNDTVTVSHIKGKGGGKGKPDGSRPVE